MRILDTKELTDVKGGGLGAKLIMGLVTAGALIVGIIDGFIRPLTCRK